MTRTEQYWCAGEPICRPHLRSGMHRFKLRVGYTTSRIEAFDTKTGHWLTAEAFNADQRAYILQCMREWRPVSGVALLEKA